MASSTYQTYLAWKDSTNWKKLVDIKSYPDLGGSPELLETTTLSDPMRTNILGIQSNDSMEFTCNYDSSDYTTLKGKEGTLLTLGVFFGGTVNASTSVITQTTADAYKFKGYLSVHINGGEVNAVREMTVTVAATTPIQRNTDPT